MDIIKIIPGEKDSNSLFVESNYGLLLFDTGAATSQLLESELTDSLVKISTKESKGAIGRKTVDTVMVEELVIGNIKAKHLQVDLDDSVGILGNDVLRNYAYTLDTSRNEIKIIEPFESDIRCIIGKRGHLYVEIKIENKTCMALIDTGASCSLIDEHFYKKTIGKTNEEKTETGEDWTGASFETPVIEVDSLAIGNVDFPPHEFAVLDFKQLFSFMEYPIAAIIGATTMSCKKFSINQIDGYLRIED